LALVNVPDEVLRPMLPLFRERHGLAVSIVYTGNDPFAAGRAGDADLVIAHFGHAGVEPFVTSGYGLWPKAVFSNQMALFGPPADPAGVRGLRSVAEALRRIAATKSPYVSNDSAGAKYLAEIAMEDTQLRGSEGPPVENAAAIRAAATRGGYVLWGVPPFLRMKRQQPAGEPLLLEPLVVADPLLQRMMVGIVVNPSKVKGINADAANTFLDFLLSPPIQARVAAFRYPDFNQQVWWPAGRHNSARD
jgi:tungstate transport system substrate-binding protein